MVETTLENTCASLVQNYKSRIAAFPKYHRAALACVKSMADASCDITLEHRNKTQNYDALAK